MIYPATILPLSLSPAHSVAVAVTPCGRFLISERLGRHPACRSFVVGGFLITLFWQLYFVAQKWLYVPLRLSPEGTESSHGGAHSKGYAGEGKGSSFARSVRNRCLVRPAAKLSPMFDMHRKIVTRRRATGWASVSPFAGRYGSSGDMGPTFIEGMQ